ncbi:MAG: hydroxysqualene dehydroxylase HpnE [FCB group bacterium]
MNGKKKIIVIGGGIAGITAAVELALKGHEILFLEASNHLGGRSHSIIDKATGEVIDNGQHLLMGVYRQFLKVTKVLGTHEQLSKHRPVKIFFAEKNKKIITYNASFLPGRAGMTWGMMTLKGISLYSKISAMIFLLKLYFNKIPKNDMSAYEFLITFNQNKNIIERFWEPLITAVMNCPSKKVASSTFIEVMKQAFFADSKSSKLILSETGMTNLLAPFPKWLEQRGGKVLFNKTIHNFIIEGNNLKGVICKQGIEFLADAVISAIPPRALIKIINESKITDEYFKYLYDLQYSGILTIYLWFDKPFLKQDFVSILNASVQWVFNRRNLCYATEDVKEKYPGHLGLTISGANEINVLSQEEILKICMKDIRDIFPESANSKLLHWRIIKERFATIIDSPEIEDKRLDAVTPYKNFYLAGDWTATGLPATIEGAARSGAKAAELIV